VNVVVVDSSSWISYFKGQGSSSLDEALKEGRVFLSPIVAAELLSAKLSEQKRSELLDFLLELPLCEGSFAHWSRVGQSRADLFRRGLSVSTPDAHVAQCALDLEGYLLTEDAIFRKIAKVSALKLVEP